MTTVNANVTAGKVFTKDVNDEALVTIEDLNNLGLPTVTVNLSGQVAATDLATALADGLITATITVGDESSNDIVVSVQAQDATGSDLADIVGFRLWLSDTAGAAPTSTLPSGGAPTVDEGTAIKALAADETGLYLTNSDGLLQLTFTEAGALVRYIQLLALNILVSGSQALTWT